MDKAFNSGLFPVSQFTQTSTGVLRHAILTVGVILFLTVASSAKAELKVRNLSAVQAAELLKENPKIRVLDVRTGFEFGTGHLKDAVNLYDASRRIYQCYSP